MVRQPRLWVWRHHRFFDGEAATPVGLENHRSLAVSRAWERGSPCGDSRIWGLSNTSNLVNVNDWIFHCGLSHLVRIPQHAKLLFLPITLQHVGIWSTKTPFLDARTALQAETKCMTKERGSCAPLMRQECQWPSRAEKSTVDDP